jgi:hypothetical protein
MKSWDLRRWLGFRCTGQSRVQELDRVDDLLGRGKELAPVRWGEGERLELEDRPFPLVGHVVTLYASTRLRFWLWVVDRSLVERKPSPAGEPLGSPLLNDFVAVGSERSRVFLSGFRVGWQDQNRRPQVKPEIRKIDASGGRDEVAVIDEVSFTGVGQLVCVLTPFFERNRFPRF